MGIIELLYASTSFIGLLSFLPQIMKLLKDKSGAESTSIATVMLWTMTSIISLAYALHVNGDMLFVFTASVFSLGNSTVLLLSLRNRYLVRI